MIIKIISLWNPWAFAMWNGLKEWETRAARAPVVAQLRRHVGDFVGIQSASMPTIKAIELFICGVSPLKTDDQQMKYEAWYNQMLVRCGDEIPGAWNYGVLGSIHRIGSVYQTQEVKPRLSEREVFFGDYSEGRRAIYLPRVLKLDKPIPMKGSQSAWDWEVTPEIERLLK